ncbi:DEXDc domain containing protein [uncultured Caudovirales phage]|uniref:DEXDc domain containing protein n=1 Tax=uncultured Caudovirales phage TaxID=2100421 RepID=A0A6J5N841_9CAUD|nr:DEXDc domain containing protein [uncultured Caudovirales phage]
MTDWPFNMPPLPVQAEALKQSDEMRGFAFFMEPGMGKTGTVMAEFTDLARKKEVDLLLVVCPNNLRANWRSEAEKMGFEYEVAIFPEPAPKLGMWIVNYEKMISKSFDEIYSKVQKRDFYAVCDESHRIKNFKAKVSKAVIYLFDHAKVKRVMTGTPMANNVVDLWAQLRAINKHGGHRSPYTFRNRFGVMGGWMGKQIVGMQRDAELKEMLAECSFTAKKKEWMASLPPKAYYTLGYEMNIDQRRFYKQIMKDRFLAIDDKEVTAQMVITALMKMQQITSGFMIDDDQKVIHLCEPGKNPKIEAIKDIIEDIPGKAIIFGHYRETINMLERALGPYDPLVIRGGMDKDDVSDIVSCFNKRDDQRVIIAQTSTAKEGLTLLGTVNVPCCTTIFAENSYSIIDRTQAEDRNHRHGQVSDQVSYYDMAGSPIEAKIIKALQDKKDLVKVVMEVRK